MKAQSDILRIVSLSILVLFIFGSVHDGGFALLSLIKSGDASGIPVQGDCAGASGGDEQSCTCLTHNLEQSCLRNEAPMWALGSSVLATTHHQTPNLHFLIPAVPPPET